MTELTEPSSTSSAFEPTYSAQTALAAIRFSFKTSWMLSRPRTAAIVILPLIQGVLPAGLALVIRGLVNAVAADDGITSDVESWILLGFLLSFLLAATVPVQRTFERINAEHLDNYLVVTMLTHADSLDFAYFESPRFRDHIAQATEDPGYTASDLIDKMTRSLSALFTLVSLMIVLAAIEPRLLLWLPPVALPYLFHRWWIARIRYETQQSQWRSKRWVKFLSQSLLDERKLPESRLLNLSPLFTGRVDKRLNKIFTQNGKLHRRELGGTVAFNMLALFVVYFALWQVSKRAISGDVTVGDVAVFAGAAGAIRNAVDGFVASIGTLRYNVLNVRHLEHFLTLPPAFPGLAPVAATPTETSGDQVALRLNSVGFSYPESDIEVLSVCRSIGRRRRDGRSRGKERQRQDNPGETHHWPVCAHIRPGPGGWFADQRVGSPRHPQTCLRRVSAVRYVRGHCI